MADTAVNVFDEARMLLNDAGATLYTNTVLLPVANKAYRELQQELGNNGIATTKEQSATLTVAAGTTVLNFTSSPALPAALLYPIQLFEKVSGEADDRFIEMHERPWVPYVQQESRLRYWTWIDDEIRLIGSTVPVPVRIRYFGGLAAFTGPTSAILVLDAVTFLAARTASIAAFTIGNSPEKAQGLLPDAQSALETLVSRNVKNRQAMPVRRKPFKAFRFRPHFRT